MNKAIVFPDFRVFMLTLSSACTLPIALAYFQPNAVMIAPDVFRQDKDILVAQFLGPYAPLIGALWIITSLMAAFSAYGILKQLSWACPLARAGQFLTALLSLGLWSLGKPFVAVLPTLIAATMLTLYFSCSEPKLEQSPQH